MSQRLSYLKKITYIMDEVESHDRFVCTVCLDILQDPVSLMCGHNYCFRCVENYWDTKGVCECPQCRCVFYPRPTLRRNTLLFDIVEKSKQMWKNAAVGYAGLEDVPCDVCAERKLRAVQSCIICQVSYCEVHVQPHREAEAFKRHILVKPTANLQQRLCPEHSNTVVHLFCRTDQKCVCSLCAAVKHVGHDLVELETERAEKQAELENTRKQHGTKIQESLMKLEPIRELVKHIQSSAEREAQEYEEIFIPLFHSIERLRMEVTEMIRNHKQIKVRKAEMLSKQLEQDLEEFKRRDTELVELFKTDDDFLFFQKLSALCVIPKDGDAPHIAVDRDLFHPSLRKDLSDLKEHWKETTGWEFMRTIKAGITSPSYILKNLMCRDCLLKYSCELTLDLSTAHRNLHMSERNTKVTYGLVKMNYPDHPGRFDFWLQVLCMETLSETCCYWEVEWNGTLASIGVAYKDMCRKGNSQASLLGRNDKSWCLRYSGSYYSVWHNNIESVISDPCSQRIGVHLDCPAGWLSFYSIKNDKVVLLYRFKATFTGPLCPGFQLLGSIKICLNTCQVTTM
ncbi:E3 ubiquitin/ISG15 ligase TRIM25-like [Polypterus senegalus]|uniref:E3 ubiquitin/ISG15 ligase TRIM25-like n=1 Tax=Polypterus senegalus TaxID=55291 RepID=UPI0019626415|nr:E3 ubiquitin/ISG15 ligase TRIM25-like [Polypterus senegalus]